MSRPLQVLAPLVCAAALVSGGCKQSAAPDPASDRTLDTLRLEVDRVNKGGVPSAPPDAHVSPTDRLAQLATASVSGEPQQLPLSSRAAVRVGELDVRPARLESMHTVRGTGKLALTTDERFVRVTLDTLNVGKQPLQLAAAEATLVDATGQAYPIARDAQNVGGSRNLDLTWAPGQSESVVLLFELPEAAVAPGLTLVLSTRGGQDTRLPLQ